MAEFGSTYQASLWSRGFAAAVLLVLLQWTCWIAPASAAWISEVFLPGNPMGPPAVEVSAAADEGTLTLAIIDTSRGNGSIKQLIDLAGTAQGAGADVRMVTAGTWSAGSTLAWPSGVDDLQLTTLGAAAATNFTAQLSGGRTLALFRMTDSGSRPSQLVVNQSWLGVRDALLPYLVDDLSYTYNGSGSVYVDGPLLPVGVGDVIAFAADGHVLVDHDPWRGVPDGLGWLWRPGPEALIVTPGRFNGAVIVLHSPSPASAAVAALGLVMLTARRPRRSRIAG